MKSYGGIPAGAEDLLVNLAIGSPAICAYRLFAGQPDAIKNVETVADKPVALFNKQESTTIIDAAVKISRMTTPIMRMSRVIV